MRSIDFTVYIEEAPAISSYTDICGTHHICICICSPLKCIHSCRQACIIKVPQMHLHKWHFIMRAQALHLRMPEMSFPFLHAPQLIASAVMIQPLRSTKLSSKQRPIEGKNKCLTNTPTSWVLKKEDIWKKKIVAGDRLQSIDKNHFKHCHQSQLVTAVQRQKVF